MHEVVTMQTHTQIKPEKRKHMENTTIDNKIKIKQATLCNATCNHSTFKVEPLHNSKSIHENLIDKSIKYIRF